MQNSTETSERQKPALDAGQLRFEGLALSPDEFAIAGIEIPTPNCNGRVMLLFTNKSIHCLPIPRFRLIRTKRAEAIRSLSLAALTGATTSRWSGFQLLFGADALSVPMFDVVPPLLSILHIPLSLFHGKELAETTKNRWEVRPISLSEGARQQLLTQVAALKQALLENYTPPPDVARHAARRKAAVMQILIGFAGVAALLIFAQFQGKVGGVAGLLLNAAGFALLLGTGSALVSGFRLFFREPRSIVSMPAADAGAEDKRQQ